jgi:uncharacterized OB-fold protein
MNIVCENCGHQALDTDNSCWHCGQPLPGRENSGRKKVKARESWTRGSGPASVAMFGGLTIAVIVAALLVMSSLGDQPQLQIRLGTRVRPDWTFITAANDLFTVTLPDTWTWQDGTDPATAGALRKLLDGDQRYQLAAHPFGAETEDMTVSFLAQGPQPGTGKPPFMIIANSPLLNRLTYDEAVTFLRNSDYNLQEVRFVDDFDKSHVSIIVSTPIDDATDEAIRCRQQFVLGQNESLLASMCAPAGRYTAYSNQFNEILASFQHLET